VTEISGADKLASLRGEMENFVGLSFDTISSVGPNGAIIHYKPSAGIIKFSNFHLVTKSHFFSNLYSNSSDVLDLRNLQKHV
jgi:hypothetical protein